MPTHNGTRVLKPNGAPYLNNHDDWVWLMEVASKAARWLGYVPFTRIVLSLNVSYVASLYLSANALPASITVKFPSLR